MKLDTSLPFEYPDLPEVYPVRRHFKDLSLPDAALASREAMERANLFEKLPAGAKVAVTAGSRGIDRIAEVIREVGRAIRDAGGDPFVVPAMGSHGGATADGQFELLAKLGITEESVEMPVKSRMETVEIARTMKGAPIYMDRLVAGAGGIFAINRVKPHSTMIGPHQSGIVKMLAVGLGKLEGAEAFHRMGPEEMARLLPDMAREILLRMPVIGGMGLVEDANGRLAKIRAAGPADLIKTDSELLEKAIELMPRLPFEEIDVLVVDEIGKDISGTGMDPNVVGRRCIRLVHDFPSPRINRIVALALSEKTMGNAHGIAMADIITERLLNEVDWESTRRNALTTRFPEKASLPLAFPTDREAVAAALATCWAADTSKAKLVRIRNTCRLEEMLVSEALVGEVKSKPELEVTGPPKPLFGDD